MDPSETLNDLIVHVRQAAKELGHPRATVQIEALGLHGYVATAMTSVPIAVGRGRTARDAVFNLLEIVVERLRVRG